MNSKEFTPSPDNLSYDLFSLCSNHGNDEKFLETAFEALEKKYCKKMIKGKFQKGSFFNKFINDKDGEPDFEKFLENQKKYQVLVPFFRFVINRYKIVINVSSKLFDIIMKNADETSIYQIFQMHIIGKIKILGLDFGDVVEQKIPKHLEFQKTYRKSRADTTETDTFKTIFSYVSTLAKKLDS